MAESGKSKVTCLECGVSYSIDLSKLPEKAKYLKCQKCGQTIPILKRLLPAKPPKGGAPEVKPVEKETAPAPPSAPHFPSIELTEDHSFGEEEGGHGADWLATYADMISILLIFFIMMFAISSVDKKKYETVMGSINAALGGHVEFPKVDTDKIPDKIDPESLLERLKRLSAQEKNNVYAVRQHLEAFIAEQNLQDKFTVSEDASALILVAQDQVMFDSGNAEIRDEIKDNMKKLGAILHGIQESVVIEGHTDDSPIHSSKYQSNWELSVMRATNVVHYLLDECGLDPNHVVAAGYAFYRPRYDMNGPDRAKNRRIEVVIKKKFGAMEELLNSKN